MNVSKKYFVKSAQYCSLLVILWKNMFLHISNVAFFCCNAYAVDRPTLKVLFKA